MRRGRRIDGEKVLALFARGLDVDTVIAMLGLSISTRRRLNAMRGHRTPPQSRNPRSWNAGRVARAFPVHPQVATLRERTLAAFLSGDLSTYGEAANELRLALEKHHPRHARPREQRDDSNDQDRRRSARHVPAEASPVLLD